MCGADGGKRPSRAAAKRVRHTRLIPSSASCVKSFQVWSVHSSRQSRESFH